MLKIRRSRDRLVFNMGIPILARRHLYIEMAPCSSQEVHSPLWQTTWFYDTQIYFLFFSCIHILVAYLTASGSTAELYIMENCVIILADDRIEIMLISSDLTICNLTSENLDRNTLPVSQLKLSILLWLKENLHQSNAILDTFGLGSSLLHNI